MRQAGKLQATTNKTTTIKKWISKMKTLSSSASQFVLSAGEFHFLRREKLFSFCLESTEYFHFVFFDVFKTFNSILSIVRNENSVFYFFCVVSFLQHNPKVQYDDNPKIQTSSCAHQNCAILQQSIENILKTVTIGRTNEANSFFFPFLFFFTYFTTSQIFNLLFLSSHSHSDRFSVSCDAYNGNACKYFRKTRRNE